MADQIKVEIPPTEPLVEVQVEKTPEVLSEDEKPELSKKQVEKLMQERLGKQAAAHKKELESLKAKIPAKQYENIEAEYKAKVVEFETEKKTLSDKLQKLNSTTLRSSIISSLARNECMDPELLAGDLINSGTVSMDDEGNIVVNSILGDLDNVVKEVIKKKPYLFKSKAVGGLGTKGPASPAELSNDEKLKHNMAQAGFIVSGGEKKKLPTLRELVANKKQR